MTAQANKHGYDMICLAACALHRELPPAERMASMSFPEVYRIAGRHGMQAITYSGLERWLAASPENAGRLSPELRKAWAEDRAKAIRKNILLDAEREKLSAFLSGRGIWHMPLKGAVLQTYYPEYGMRQMTDNDILFDGNFRPAVREYFLENGFTESEKEDSSHDVYSKPPVCNFEMHFSLYRPAADSLFYDYYKNVKDRLLPPDAEASSEYRFRGEDFYIYLLAHSCKHFLYAGIGIRFLLDLYVYLEAEGDRLDRQYIAEECETLGLTLFEASAGSLAEKFFRKPGITEEELTEEERELAAFFLSSDAHGTAENRTVQQIRASAPKDRPLTAGGKLRYLWKRLFPDMETVQKNYPFFYRHRILLPFLVFVRAFRLLLRRPGDLVRELKLVRKTKK